MTHKISGVQLYMGWIVLCLGAIFQPNLTSIIKKSLVQGRSKIQNPACSVWVRLGSVVGLRSFCQV
jgi:hypothetical protein